ncbi:MAG: hypothetical protein II799_00370, partial [Lachnospiraceae bacterium]|nr:hypothetical protein [Lachnospiraceae bacterium]
MANGSYKTELNKVIYLCMIMCVTILSILLIILDLLLDWDIWMIPVIICGAAICWIMFLKNMTSQRARIYVCGILGAFLVF